MVGGVERYGNYIVDSLMKGKKMLPSQVYMPKDFESEVRKIQLLKEFWQNGKKKYVDKGGNIFEIAFNDGLIFVN